VTVPTAMSGTPATTMYSGNLITTYAALQTAITNVACGTTIQIAAGAVLTGDTAITIPNHGCDINHWIIIETSAYSSLPSEGTRITPCYSGVASLPGRPAYPCSSPSNTTAQVAFSSNGTGPFQFLAGANFYRFIGLEITRPSGMTAEGILNSTDDALTSNVTV
jgi:hypothetical protein